MFMNVNIVQLTVVTAFAAKVFAETNSPVYKRRMCLQFEMKDHSKPASVIGQRYYRSKAECITSCTRHRSCSAFNFRSLDGSCGLLETSPEMCMSHNVTKGSTLVKMTACNKMHPWKVIKPTPKKLRWMEPHDVGFRQMITVSTKSASGNSRHVAHALHEGVYLPGFVNARQGRFHGLTMENDIIECNEAFRVLTYAHPNDYMWINFTIGDGVPPSAVVGGYWRDGKPLYVISAPSPTGIWKSGFYDAVATHIYVKSLVDKYKLLALLVENDWK